MVSPERRASAAEEALRLSIPSWPLQNTVAVNPFWNLREKDFHKVMAELSPLLHHRLYMPLDYYLDKYARGSISEDALSSALAAARNSGATNIHSLDELIWASSSERSLRREVLSFAEFYARERNDPLIAQLLVDEVSRYAAGFFDRTQALARFPWQDCDFWEAWRRGYKLDYSLEAAGFPNAHQSFEPYSRLARGDFIEAAVRALGLGSQRDQTLYFSRILALHLGWSTQFRYKEWQVALGVERKDGANILDFLSVCIAYDLIVALGAAAEDNSILRSWVQRFASIKTAQQSKVHEFELHQIWQNAFELSYQRSIAGSLQRPLPPPRVPRYQLIFCIDVRSEILRRALEARSEDIVTRGFAGFFGMPIAYRRLNEKKPQARLPVLLAPAYLVNEKHKSPRKKGVEQKDYLSTFLRNLRKGSLTSFLFVELFGLLSVLKLGYRVLQSVGAALRQSRLPPRFDDREYECDLSFLGETHAPAHADCARWSDYAMNALKNMGLTRDFSSLVLIVGHGSETQNNAFASSLDCGACGGHAGDINARFLADLLNHPSIRQRLAERGLTIPASTCFVAAIHETVSDSLFLLDREKVPERFRADLNRLEELMQKATRSAQRERQVVRSVYLAKGALKRSQNWSEVRPEWGLAGNACFIVAPRAWTEGLNFGSRSFLHDYSWQLDEDFKVLELIMTAPMVVTNWINLQYYASTVAPAVYGSGSKVLHNIVNEAGVLEGNAGGFRIGLPWQSVHDGAQFVHEPLRLSVLIAAPEAAIERIIAQHAVVRSLVENEWLFILRLDDERSVSLRRQGGTYEALYY